MRGKHQTNIAASNQPGKKEFQRHLDIPPIRTGYLGTGKLKDKVALVTGGDSGIGRSVAVHYAREGADIAIVYLESDQDAVETQKMVEEEGARCLLLRGDISNERFCRNAVESTVRQFRRLDILVNNAGMHEDSPDVKDITQKQLVRTFAVNMFSFFYFTQQALSYMKKGGVIINTASVVAYRGSEHLLDYSASKGAIVSFTRSLAESLADKKIRVNGVAPGPVWTPLVVYSFDKQHLRKFGKNTLLGRAGYPQELAPAYVWLASEESSFMTGQMIHVNGGEIING